MLKNWLLTAWLHLARQKLFALINILGLAIGMAVFILVFLYVQKEYSWDRHWEHADRIYWLTNDFHFNETTSFKGAAAHYPMTSLLRENFPEAIEASARVINRGQFIHAGENRYAGGFVLAERDILDIFDFDVVSGSLEETLAVPGRVAILQDDATRYFGAEDPLGQTLSLEVDGRDELYDYRVTAVFSMPEETSARIRSLSLLEESAVPEMADDFDNWFGPIRAVNYLLLREDADVDAMNRRLVDIVDSSMPKEPWRFLAPGERMSDFHQFAVEPLARAHFDETLRTDTSGDRNKVLVFALIGVLVLVMGSTNFVILATAKADDRRKEVGIRKVLGATRKQLVAQYLGESLIFTLVALLVALALVAFSLQYFSSLVGLTLSLDLLDPAGIVTLLLLMICVGVLGGLYPAVFLSGFTLAGIFRPDAVRVAGKAIRVRGVLACFQFAIAIALIVATLVLYFQLNFIRGLDLGFATDNIFVLQLNDESLRNNATALRNELGTLTGVEQIASATHGPVSPGIAFFSVGSFKREQSQAEVDTEGFWVDSDFFDFFGIDFLAGRPYDPARDLSPASDEENDEGEQESRRRIGKLIVNEQFVDGLDFDSPEQAIGQIVYRESTDQDGELARSFSEIIGVVENTKYRALNAAPMAEIYSFSENMTSIIALKYLESAEDTLLGRVEAIWNRVSPDSIFMGEYLEQALIEAYAQERNEGKLLVTMSALAIFIAGMGLYGLAAYAVKQGVKEIGIRKVLGATSRQVMLLFLWRFSAPVLLANIIAWPAAVLIMLRWLQRFAEQIEYSLLVPLCLLATVLALLIAWVTVGLTTVRAARANPVKSLRYE